MSMRKATAAAVLGTILAASLCPTLFPRLSYSQQNREHASARPSLRFPLGTDDLGRDRLARLLHASRI